MFLLFISAARQSGALIRDMTVVNFRTLVSSCIPVSGEPCRPSTGFGAAGSSKRDSARAAGVSSFPSRDVSVGQLIASSSLQVSPGAAEISSIPVQNVSVDQVVASSSHQASTRAADISSIPVIDESDVMVTSSPIAGSNQFFSGGTGLISRKRDRSGE